MLADPVDRQAAQRRTAVIALVTAILIYLLLQGAFGSWRLAATTFLSLPLALVGGVLAMLLTGGVLSLGALVGFLLLLGIATRNGVMLVRHYQHLEQDEGEAFGPGLIMRGARERLTPIALTIVVAGDLSQIERPIRALNLGTVEVWDAFGNKVR